MNVEQFDYSVDLLQSIIWQYQTASNLQELIIRKNEWYEIYQTEFWQNWYTNVFNLQTANTFGIVVWSFILNVPLFVNNSPEPSDKPIFGFNQIVSYPTLENSYLNFENSTFSIKGQYLVLTTEEQRFLLRLRYFQLTTRGDVTDINYFLNYLCTTSNIGYSGRIYVVDNLDMTMTYTFTVSNTFSYSLFEAITKLDIFPRPAGVSLSYVGI